MSDMPAAVLALKPDDQFTNIYSFSSAYEVIVTGRHRPDQWPVDVEIAMKHGPTFPNGDLIQSYLALTFDRVKNSLNKGQPIRFSTFPLPDLNDFASATGGQSMDAEQHVYWEARGLALTVLRLLKVEYNTAILDS